MDTFIRKSTFSRIESTSGTKSFAYPSEGAGRDLRIDFLRGFVMLVVITVHLEYLSFFSLFAWERVGLISSAEGFVALSGLVVGIVYCKKLNNDGFVPTAQKLFKRAWQLYRVNVVVILSIPLLGMIPLIDIYAVSHWSLPSNAGPVYALYPPESANWTELVYKALLLKIGPHQFQVIGLYVLFLAASPLAIYLMHKQKTVELLTISWAVYIANQFLHIQLTDAKFDLAFPILSWQLLFFNALAVGFHRKEITRYISNVPHRLMLAIAGLLSLAFAFLAWNNPSPFFWPLKPLSYVDPAQYKVIYNLGFQKGALGIGRIVNNIAVFIIAFSLLSRYWHLFNKAIGWLVIPIGQASLYVFIVHVYFVLLISNIPLSKYDSIYLNTIVHGGAILSIWWMVKHKVFFNIIPR